MIPKFPVKVSFDPAASNVAADMWKIPAGRILMLLWRPTRLCGPDWWGEATAIADRIQRFRPSTAEGLYECFRPAFSGQLDFTPGDAREFCDQAIEFFTGKRSVPYDGVVLGEASIEPV